MGVLVVTAAGLLAYMALQIGAIRGSGPTVEVDAVLPDAAGLSEGAVVSIAGVQVGRVTKLAIDYDHAKAHLSIDAGADVRKDVKVAVRSRSVLGEKYIELRPQSKDAPPLTGGEELTDLNGQVEIDEMVTDMGPLLKAIDPEAITLLTQAMKEDPERPKRMLADTERALHNLAVASDELPALMKETRETLADVRKATDKAEATLARADRAVDQLDKLASSVDPARIDRLLDQTEGAVKDTRDALAHVDRTLSKVDQTTDEARKIVKGWSDVDWETFRKVAQETGIYVRVSPVK